MTACFCDSLDAGVKVGRQWLWRTFMRPMRRLEERRPLCQIARSASWLTSSATPSPVTWKEKPTAACASAMLAAAALYDIKRRRRQHHYSTETQFAHSPGSARLMTSHASTTKHQTTKDWTYYQFINTTYILSKVAPYNALQPKSRLRYKETQPNKLWNNFMQ